MYNLPNELKYKILEYIPIDIFSYNKYNDYLYIEFNLSIPKKIKLKYEKEMSDFMSHSSQLFSRNNGVYHLAALTEDNYLI